MRRQALGLTACFGLALITFPVVRLIGSALSPEPGRLVPENDPVVWDARRADSSTKAQPAAMFRVRNSGETPVQIRSIRSGCDCAVPRVEPKIVPPGGSAVVEVVSEPPEFGERTVVVTLVTDSPVTPEIPLHLRLKGQERESDSHLLRAGGDLTYMGDWSPAEPRRLIATTVQSPGDHQPPEVICDLPFLAFELIDLDEMISTTPSIAFRNYTYQARFTAPPPAGRFHGEVIVIDPWNPTKQKTIKIHGVTPEPIQIIPPRLILRVGENEGEGDAKAVLRLRVRDPDLAPSVAPEDPENSPIIIRSTAREDDGVERFVIELKDRSGEVAEGIHNVIVRPSPNSSEQRVVPVMVRKDDRS